MSIFSPPEFENFAASRGLSIPTSGDYGGAIAALIRLQKTYNLPVDPLTKGLIHGKLAQGALDKDDMYALAEAAKTVDHSIARDWFVRLLEEVKADDAATITERDPSDLSERDLDPPKQELNFKVADIYSSLAYIYQQVCVKLI